MMFKLINSIQREMRKFIISHTVKICIIKKIFECLIVFLSLKTEIYILYRPK